MERDGDDVMVMTKDEFGMDLFDAISYCGGILQLRQMREKTKPERVKPNQLKLWQQRERELRNQVNTLIPKLSDEQAAELVRRYQWLLEE